jgi:hypothetical protein
MVGVSYTHVLRVCKYCKSDEVVYIDKEKVKVRCLKCKKIGDVHTIWRIRKTFKGGGFVWKEISEQERIGGYFLNGRMKIPTSEDLDDAISAHFDMAKYGIPTNECSYKSKR